MQSSRLLFLIAAAALLSAAEAFNFKGGYDDDDYSYEDDYDVVQDLTKDWLLKPTPLINISEYSLRAKTLN